MTSTKNMIFWVEKTTPRWVRDNDHGNKSNKVGQDGAEKSGKYSCRKYIFPLVKSMKTLRQMEYEALDEDYWWTLDKEDLLP